MTGHRAGSGGTLPRRRLAALGLLLAALAAVGLLARRPANPPQAGDGTAPEAHEPGPRPVGSDGLSPPLEGRPIAAPPHRAALVGRVTDALGGGAASGCRVVAQRTAPGGAERAETFAGRDGRYAFDDLRPGPWRAFAVAPGRAPGGVADARPDGYDPLQVDLVAGVTSTLDLVLEAAATATGRVLDADGTPYAGATVAALPDGWPRATAWQPELTWVARATTDADGTYRIESIPEGTAVWIEATAPDRLRVEDGPRVASVAAPIQVDLRFEAVRFVDVSVVDDATGDPVARAEVTGWFPQGTGGWKGFDDAWIADERGRLRAGPFPAGPVKVSARPPGRLILPPNLGEPIPPGQNETVIRLVGGSGGGQPIPAHPPGPEDMRWPAHVVAEGGRPVPRGWTRVYGSDAAGGGKGIVDGWSDLRLRGPLAEVWIEAFDAKTPDDAPLPYGAVRVRGAAKAPVDLVMPPERTIDGRVVGPGERGVPGVLVVATPDWWRGTRVGSRWPFAHSTARTDASGAFRLGRLADTEYDLEVRPPASLGAGLLVAARAGAKGVTIRLESSARGTITVLDDQGAPVADAEVRVGTADALQREFPGTRGSHVRRGRTDGEGRVTFEAIDPAASLQVAVVPPAARAELKSPVVRPWRGEDTTIRLERRWWIRGVVRTLSGVPAPTATLSIVEAARPGPATAWTSSGVPLAPDGSFAIERSSPDPVRLRVDPRGVRPPGPPIEGAVTVRPGDENVVLVVDLGLVLEVLLEGEGPDVFGTAWIESETGRRARSPSVRMDGGRVRFEGLAADDTYRVFVSLLGDGHRVAFLRGLRAGGPEVRTRAVPALRIEGTVQPRGDPHGTVSADADGLRVSAAVDADGTFSIDGLPPGRYRVSATARRAGGPWRASAVAEAGTAGLELRLAPP